MQSRLQVHGHPIQPMLVTFPFGLFVCAVIFDLADAVGGPALLAEVGYWTLIAALFAAMLAAVAGLVELWDVPTGRTHRTALAFNVVNAAMALAFVLVCLIRAGTPKHAATGSLIVVELLALAVGAAGVRLGAVLVRQYDEVRRWEATTFDALSPSPTALAEARNRAVPVEHSTAATPVGPHRSDPRRVAPPPDGSDPIRATMRCAW